MFATANRGPVQTLTPEAIARSRSLPSVGGQNRYLAIPLDGGQVHSVGQQPDGTWASWHPFVGESFTAFPGRSFRINGIDCRADEYLAVLGREALAALDQVGGSGPTVHLRTQARLPRGDLVRFVGQIAAKLAELHRSGLVHGDLKPENILATTNGPLLIDSFDIEPGTTSPGWTPEWSAPEQALGQPVDSTADLYPLGRMLARALGAELAGEVRKYRTSGRREFDLFHNPSVDVSDVAIASADDEGLVEWMRLVQACTRFDPGERPPAEVAAEEIERLAVTAPIGGEVHLALDDEIVLARLPDGLISVCRLRGESQGNPVRPPPPGPVPPPPPGST
jgi:hypothetical protein